MARLLWLSRRVLAAVTSTMIVVSYITCIIISKTDDTYIGGIAWPFFSDTGRDKPAYYVFAVLNTVASCLQFPFMILQYRYMREWFRHVEAGCECRITAALVMGITAPVGSILLSVFATHDHPKLHSYSAYAFFVLILAYSIIHLTLMRSLAAHDSQHRTLLYVRFAVVGVLAVGILLYIPVGLAVGCSERLTFAKCLQTRSLSFCEDNRLDDTLTKLHDYTDCDEANTMRSITQFISIVSLMVYVALHAFDPDPRPQESPAAYEGEDIQARQKERVENV